MAKDDYTVTTTLNPAEYELLNRIVEDQGSNKSRKIYRYIVEGMERDTGAVTTTLSMEDVRRLVDTRVQEVLGTKAPSGIVKPSKLEDYGASVPLQPRKKLVTGESIDPDEMYAIMMLYDGRNWHDTSYYLSKYNRVKNSKVSGWDIAPTLAFLETEGRVEKQSTTHYRRWRIASGEAAE